MAKLTSSELIELWSRRLSASKAFKKKHSSKHYDQMIRLLLGEHWDADDPRWKPVQVHQTVNMCWRIVRAYVPILYLDDPQFLCREDMGAAGASNTQAQERVRALEKWFEQVINREWRLANCREQIRDCVTDAIVYGYAVACEGWYEVPEDTYASDTQGRKRRNFAPYVDRVSPREILEDTQVTDFDDCTWIARTYVRRYFDVMGDSRYRKIWSDLEPTIFAYENEEEMGAINADNYGSMGASTEKVRQMDGYVRFWEIMTMEEGGRMLTFTESAETKKEGENFYDISLDLLARDEDLPYRYLGGFPYRFLSFNKINDVLYPPSDIQMIEEIQKDFNFQRSIQSEHARNQKSIYLANPDMVTPAVAKRVQGAQDGEMVTLEGEGRAIDGAFRELTRTSLNPDVYIQAETYKSDIYEITGIDQAMRNEVMKGETATAVMQRSNASQVRLQDRTLVMIKWVEALGLDFSRILLNEARPETVYPVILDERSGQPTVLQIGDFNLQYEIKLEPENAFPIHRQIETTQFLSAVNLLMNNPFIDQREVAIRVFEHFNIRRIDQLVPALNIPPEIIQLLQNNPQFFQAVMQLAQTVIQQMQAQQKAAEGAQAASPERGRAADVNQLQEAEAEANRGNASATQGGGGI